MTSPSIYDHSDRLFKKIMRNYDYLLQPLRLSYRQGNLTGMRVALSKVLKKALEPMISAEFRAEAYLESIKAYRSLGESETAERYCDAAIANLQPFPNSMQMLAAYKRLRVLLFLDAEEFTQAASKLEECDGIEISLQEGQTHISRKESDITVETWLLAVEVALAQENIEQARNSFTRAVNSLAEQEVDLRKKRLSPLEMRKHEQYLSDVRFMCDVYGAVLRIILEDPTGYEVLCELKARVIEQNEFALQSHNLLPNQPLLAKLKCVLGEWLPDEPQSPNGINFAEARRWVKFGLLRISEIKTVIKTETSVISHQPQVETVVSVPSSGSHALFNPVSDAGQGNRMVNALEQIATAFQRLEMVAPHLENLAFEKDASRPHSSKAALFGGHLMYFDLDALLYNAKQGELTGYIKLTWKPEYYESQIILGSLPDKVSGGEAFLFVVAGVVTDATIGSAGESQSVDDALANFKTIVKLCFSIGLDIPPDLHGEAVQASNVANRKAFLDITQDDLINYLTKVENETAGISSSAPDEDRLDEAFAAFENINSQTETINQKPNLFDDGDDDFVAAFTPSDFTPKDEEKKSLPTIGNDDDDNDDLLDL